MDDADGNYFKATNQVVWWHMQSHTQMKGTPMGSPCEHTGGQNWIKSDPSDWQPGTRWKLGTHKSCTPADTAPTATQSNLTPKTARQL
jgi:hypothetical protein